jgi:hypothetical protein
MFCFPSRVSYDMCASTDPGEVVGCAVRRCRHTIRGSTARNLARLLCGLALCALPGCGSREPSPFHPRLDASQLRVPISDLRIARMPDMFPALSDPPNIAAAAVDFLKGEDRVIGVQCGDQARAYPVAIVNWHHLVNDELAGVPVLVSYCVLCRSALVFDRRMADEAIEFGVAGLLYKGNMVMFERGRSAGGLWTQLDGRAISGRHSGQELMALPCEETTWCDWVTRFPNSTVLARASENLSVYQQPGRAFAPPGLRPPDSTRFDNGAAVLGVWSATGARAYAFDNDCDRRIIHDELDGLPVTVEWDPIANAVRVLQADSALRWCYSDWAAWEAFHPDSEIIACGQPVGVTEAAGG